MENKTTNHSQCQNADHSIANPNFPSRKAFLFTNFSPTAISNNSQLLKTNSSSGFITLSACLLFTIIISSSFAILACAWFLTQKQHAELLCQKYVIKAQEDLLQGAEALLLLNPKAEALIVEKKYLEFSIKVNPNPVQKAIEAARLAVVIYQMSLLRLEQKAIFTQAEASALAASFQFKQKTHSLTQSMQSNWKSAIIRTPSISTTLATIRLVPIFKDPLLPIYQAPIDFESQQTLRYQMSLKTQGLLPSWISYLAPHFTQWQESCSSKPQKQGVQSWTAALTRDKSFLRP